MRERERGGSFRQKMKALINDRKKAMFIENVMDAKAGEKKYFFLDVKVFHFGVKFE